MLVTKTLAGGFMTRNTRKTFWLQVAEFPCHHDSAPPGAYESLEVALRNGESDVALRCRELN